MMMPANQLRLLILQGMVKVGFLRSAVTLVAIFAAVFVVGQQDTVDSPYALRGLGLDSHSASYGFNSHHGTFDNDALDEWGSVTCVLKHFCGRD